MTSVFGYPAGAAPRHGGLWYKRRRLLHGMRPRLRTLKRTAVLTAIVIGVVLAGKFIENAFERANSAADQVVTAAAADPSGQHIAAATPAPVAASSAQGAGASSAESPPVPAAKHAVTTDGRADPQANAASRPPDEQITVRQEIGKEISGSESTRSGPDRVDADSSRPRAAKSRRTARNSKLRHVAKRNEYQNQYRPEFGSHYPQWGFVAQTPWRPSW